MSPSDGPIISEDQLTSLPLVKVVPDGQYTGTHLNAVVRMMRGLLEQKVPLQEFEVLVTHPYIHPPFTSMWWWWWWWWRW